MGYFGVPIRNGVAIGLGAIPSLKSGTGGSSTPSPIFSLLAQSTLVPEAYTGSSTPTFTRATTAYDTDWEGLLKPVLSGESRFTGARRVQNVVEGSSENLTTSPWTTYSTEVAPIVTGGQTDVPDSRFATSTKVVVNRTTTGGYSEVYQSITPSVAGKYPGSFFIKAFAAGDIGKQISAFQFDSASVINIITVTLTGSWVRYALGTTSSFTATFNNQPCSVGYLAGSLSQTGAVSFLITGVQAEPAIGQTNTNPSEYVSVGVASTPWFGANKDGVKYFTTLNGNTVSSNVVTEATGAAIKPANGSSATTTDASGPFGYLSEAAATNLILWSNDVTNASWVKTTMTTAKTSTGPDGVANSATRCTDNGAGNALALQTYVAAASSRTYSLWVKRITGSGNFQLTQDGVSFTTVTTTAGWTQVQLNANQLNAVVGFRIVGASDAFDIWCNQFEAGAVATSPIPTTTAAVTRNADSDTYATASNFSDTAGTMYAEVLETSWASVAGTIIGSATQGMLPLTTNSGVKGYDGTNTVNGAAGTPSGFVKMAVAWTGSTMTVCANGGTVSSGSYDGAWNLTTLGIGIGTNANIRNVKVYGTALSNSALQALTT